MEAQILNTLILTEMNVTPSFHANTGVSKQINYKPGSPHLKSNDHAGRDSYAEAPASLYHATWQQQTGPAPLKVFKSIQQDDFKKWNIEFLTEYLVKTHHAFAKKNVDTIHRLAQKVSYRHCENHPELLTLIEVIFLFQHDLLNQMKKEEQTIFPYFDQKNGKLPDNEKTFHPAILIHRMKWMKYENEKALNYLKVFRHVTYNFGTPSDACNSYKDLFEKLREFEEDMHLHIYLENEVLFPRIAGSPR